MNYVKYNRSFVMMEEQNNKFASKSSAPIKGYLKVETGNNKGAMRCAVQNLHYYPKKDYVYKLILFGKRGEKTIHTIIGNLLINRQGNGETYFRFHPLDIDGKGNPYHNYSTAIIAAASTVNSEESLHPVLKGITFEENSSFQSELFEINSEEEEEIESVMDDAKKKDQEAADEEPVWEDSHTETEEFQVKWETPGAETEEFQVKWGDPGAETEEPRVDRLRPETEGAEIEGPIIDDKEAEELDENMESPKEIAAETDHEAIAARRPDSGRATEPEMDEACLDPAQIATPGIKESESDVPERGVEKKLYNDFYNRYILNACAHTCRVAEHHEDVVPFSKDRTGAQWKKIVNVANLPLVSPGAHYFATQYHHYIFGAKADEKGMAVRYYIGIPGRFLSEEQPDGGHSGFTFWQPIRGAESLVEGLADDIKKRKSAYGYWIVAIDGKTGNIQEV